MDQYAEEFLMNLKMSENLTENLIEKLKSLMNLIIIVNLMGLII